MGGGEETGKGFAEASGLLDPTFSDYPDVGIRRGLEIRVTDRWPCFPGNDHAAISALIDTASGIGYLRAGNSWSQSRW